MGPEQFPGWGVLSYVYLSRNSLRFEICALEIYNRYLSFSDQHFAGIESIDLSLSRLIN